SLLSRNRLRSASSEQKADSAQPRENSGSAQKKLRKQNDRDYCLTNHFCITTIPEPTGSETASKIATNGACTNDQNLHDVVLVLSAAVPRIDFTRSAEDDPSSDSP